MDNEEIKSLIEQLKATGLGEEEIMDVFYKTFEKGKMDRKDLETLANEMGYELTDEFKNDEHLDPIETEGEETTDLDDAKELKPGETKDEFKDRIDDMDKVEDGDEVEGDDDSDDVEDKDDDENEEEEWKEAQKLFKI